MTNQEIKALRKSLKETRRVFARRFGVSYRTVESWEQGAHVPHPTVRKALEALRDPLVWQAQTALRDAEANNQQHVVTFNVAPDIDAIDDSGGKPRYCEMCDVWMTETECPACGAEAVRAAK